MAVFCPAPPLRAQAASLLGTTQAFRHLVQLRILGFSAFVVFGVFQLAMYAVCIK